MKLENLDLAVKIREALDEVDTQIRFIKHDVISAPSPHGYLSLKHRDGTYVVTPMLETKATLLLALSNLHSS